MMGEVDASDGSPECNHAKLDRQQQVTCTISRSASLALAFIIVFLPSSLLAWGREGHEIVAMRHYRDGWQIHEGGLGLLSTEGFLLVQSILLTLPSPAAILAPTSPGGWHGC
jgi:hypothetical protein